MESLIQNNTWNLYDLPVDGKVIPTKWVFRIKKNSDGSIEKYKARLVAKGFRQCYVIDYSDIFSPVAKFGTVRSILSIAASENLHLVQFDVSTAFLYCELKEIIYIKQPEGFHDGTSKICELKKSLFGLKQSSRCWNIRFHNFLISLGFHQSEEIE